MKQRRSIGYVLLVIGVVIAPTALSLSWYHITKDPNLRPLAITKQALAAYGLSSGGLEIVAVVEGPDATSASGMARAITNAFAAKGMDVRIVVRSGPGVRQVTYRVGSSVLGPYPAARASEGIAAAVQAYRMH